MSKSVRRVILSLLLLASALGSAAAREYSPLVWRRFARLERLVKAGSDRLPDDMVVYRYVADTLQSWTNVFPLRNDDIRTPVLGDSRGAQPSPLSAVGDSAVVVKMGSLDYLVKAVDAVGPSGEKLKTIYGLRLGAHKQSGPVEQERRPSLLFSPSLYAGRIFRSLGMVLLFNLLLCVSVLLLYLARRRLSLAPPLYAGIGVALVCYAFVSLRSIVLNSNINLELYKLSELSVWSGVVYLSYILLLLCVPLLWVLVSGKPLSRISRLAFSLFCAVFMISICAKIGYEKELSRTRVWSERLSIERDISLELALKSSESSLMDDPVIPLMISQGRPQSEISSYLTENYFFRLAKDYDFAVLTESADEGSAAFFPFFMDDVGAAEPVAPMSAFFYSGSEVGRIRYFGYFTYPRQGGGEDALLLGIESRANRGNRGYARILGMTPPGGVIIPSVYAYAKYKDRDLQFFSGNYPYPTSLDDALYIDLYSGSRKSVIRDGYTHFLSRITDDEAVMISRPNISFYSYFIFAAFIAVLVYIILTLPPSVKRSRLGRKGYYRSRISYVLMSSLTLTLAAMMVTSVFFVYRRNEQNKLTMMSDKINSIRSLTENQFRSIPGSPDGIQGMDLKTILKSVSEIAGTDVTLFDKSGKMIMSTVSDFFNTMVLSGRMDDEAYNTIIRRNKRYFIHAETLRSKRFYNMYAPLLDDRAQLQAIICSPYTDEGFDFELDAIMHLISIVTAFLILVLLTRLISSEVLDRLFKPLNEMGEKMQSADIDHLEYIDYDRDDEISSLVAAYNRMVGDLKESTHKLAQAERDKAWTGMARQVAHEIKNPLTPMKLQLQRLVRLKQKGDERWQEKFDEVSALILDHIDILSDTANEFSQLARLGTEEMTPINLGQLIEEEMAMFDASAGVKFEYIGLEGAEVTGPRPQLARVIVNLLTNSVQALQGVEDGRIMVSLRNSVKDGFFDIVVEDNGPGVSEENIEKLFSPNFTTKSGGSGLGLAISRSILERCSATISYSRSFTLGGACFTVSYPKMA
ncbi:MAG: cache domain-containing protein [Bacteroidales bacterium]|nr:cache domain-containing protein [Bacteroidales bacterium]